MEGRRCGDALEGRLFLRGWAADLEDDAALGDGGQVQEEGLEAVHRFALGGALRLSLLLPLVQKYIGDEAVAELKRTWREGDGGNFGQSSPE